MSQYRIHADISTQEFPYNFFELSSTTIVSNALEQDAQGEIPGTPQAYYMENVLPISRGYVNVSFTEKVPANEGISNIVDSFPIYGENGRVALFQYSEDTAWVFDPSGGTWVELELPITGLDNVTFGTVREATYIHLGVGLFRYNFQTQELEEVSVPTLPGIGETLGVCAAGNQLILWTTTRLFYSSVEDPLDFFPDIATGAGTTGIQQLRGTIIACITLGKDFIIYSDQNAVSARWTENLAFPFRYDQIRGSAGVNNVQHIGFNNNLGAHIVWTQSGFQQVSIEQAQYVFPELSDGIIRGLLIRRDDVFLLPDLVKTKNLDVAVNFVSNRFLTISVKRLGQDSEASYFDCYVLDTALSRWGKLNVPHVGFLEYVVPEVFEPYTYDKLAEDYSTYGEMESGGLSYRGLIPTNSRPEIEIGSNLGIVLPTGAVYAISYWETSDNRGTDGSVIGATTPSIFFGKYKLQRNVGILTQWMKLTELFTADLYWYGHLYNGDFCTKKLLEFENSEQPGQWFGGLAGDSVSLEIRGSFKLTNLELCLADAGNVNQPRLNISEDVILSTEVLAEPEYDFATSWLYSPFAEDSVLASSSEGLGSVNRLNTQPMYTEISSVSAQVMGSVVLDSIVEYTTPYTESVEVTPTVQGTVILDTVVNYVNNGTEETQVSASVTGAALLTVVVIPVDIGTEETSAAASVVGTVELVTV